MNRSILFAFGIALFAFACQTRKDPADAAASDTTAVAQVATLKIKWETDTVLTTCESVIYDKSRDILYVASINGQPDKKDGNGFIAKVSLDGKVVEAQWIKGLDAPKGMGIVEDKLYVTDIDRVHEIDLTAGKVSKTFKLDGAQFLNDITTDPAGRVFISDTGAGIISVIENGEVSRWLENVDGGPNGLLAEPNRLLLLTFQGQSLNTIDPSNKQVTLMAEGIDSGDGVEAVGDGSYLVSSWSGMVHLIGSDWSKTQLLDTRADSVNAADIEYIPEHNLLIIPTFFNNKVVAYELTKPTTVQ